MPGDPQSATENMRIQTRTHKNGNRAVELLAEPAAPSLVSLGSAKCAKILAEPTSSRAFDGD
jgi:hypothetical protein